MVLSFCNKNGKGVDEQIVINNVFGQCNYSKKPDYKATYFSLNEVFFLNAIHTASQTWLKFLYILIKGINLVYCYRIFWL